MKQKTLIISTVITLALITIPLTFLAFQYQEKFMNDYLISLISYRPPYEIYPLIGLSLVFLALYKLWVSCWEEAKPNEWLVIVENGEQVKSGIGLICWRWFWQTAIKFPSSVQKVNFSAMQVCSEMQGLKIQGFAVWSVHRLAPFTFYRQMFGVNANQQIQSICESIVRHQISNTELNTVMTKRDVLKEKMQQEASKILSGWGVWVEAVEITDVTICSQHLFQDMQTPSKQENYLKSELFKIEKEYEMEISRQRANHEIIIESLIKQTESKEQQHEQAIKRLQQEASYKNKQHEHDKIKLKQEIELQMQRDQVDFETEIAALKDDQAIQEKIKETEREKRRKEIIHEQELTDVNLFNEKCTLLQNMYKSAYVKKINLNAYQEQSKSSLFNILPSLKIE